MNKSSYILISIILMIFVSLLCINVSFDNNIKNINIKSPVINNDLLKFQNKLVFNEVNDEEEISLGSISHCANESTTCSSGRHIDNKCKEYKRTSCREYNCLLKLFGICVLRGTTCTAYNWGWVDNGVSPVTTCTKCDSGYYLSDGKCLECKITKLNPLAKTVSPGDTWCAYATYNSALCAGSATYSPGQCKAAPKGVTNCPRDSIKASVNGSSKSVSVRVVGSWVSVADAVYEQPFVETNSYGANDGSHSGGEPQMEYGNCYANDPEPDGKVTYSCTNVHKRGTCGTSKPVVTYNFCCVDNGFVGVSKNVHWFSKRLKKSCSYYLNSSGYTLLEIPESQCKATQNADIPKCTGNTKPKKEEKEATKCEDTVPIELKQVKCTDEKVKTNDSFYTIECTRKVNTGFDYGDDGITNGKFELNKGQGFRFAINVSSSVRCTGNFYKDKWINVYKVFEKKIEAVEYGYTKHDHAEGLLWYVKNYNPKKAKESKEQYKNYIDKYLKPKHKQGANDAFYLWNTYYEPLLNAITSYNEYDPNDGYNEAAQLSIPITVNGKEKTIKSTFTTIGTIDKGNYRTLTSTVVDLAGQSGVKKLENPKNYIKSSESAPRKVKLVPEEVYFEKGTGTLTKTPTDMSGGNKVYFDYDTDLKEYTMTINVTGLGTNESKINNNKCKVSIKDLDIVYRPIELKNPFINSNWDKGENWVNNKYNFTKTIHKATWSEPTLKTINLKSNQIAALQTSTKKYISNGYYPYLGICDTIKTTSQDEITKSLCKTLKSLSS